MKDTMIGVDLAKRVFQIHGASTTGQVKFRKKLTREQFRRFMSEQPACIVVFEACGSASYWAREMETGRVSNAGPSHLDFHTPQAGTQGEQDGVSRAVYRF